MSSQGKLISLELKEEYANLAHQNLDKAGFGDRVTYYIGEALDSLANSKNRTGTERLESILIPIGDGLTIGRVKE